MPSRWPAWRALGSFGRGGATWPSVRNRCVRRVGAVRMTGIRRTSFGARGGAWSTWLVEWPRYRGIVNGLTNACRYCISATVARRATLARCIMHTTPSKESFARDSRRTGYRTDYRAHAWGFVSLLHGSNMLQKWLIHS